MIYKFFSELKPGLDRQAYGVPTENEQSAVHNVEL